MYSSHSHIFVFFNVILQNSYNVNSMLSSSSSSVISWSVILSYSISPLVSALLVMYFVHQRHFTFCMKICYHNYSSHVWALKFIFLKAAGDFLNDDAWYFLIQWTVFVRMFLKAKSKVRKKMGTDRTSTIEKECVDKKEKFCDLPTVYFMSRNP